MAEMIPETIAAHQNVTPGEKRVFKVLREACQPDEDFLVWYEPRAIDRYPDFIVWGQDLGLLVVEVKDWVVSQIIEMNSKFFKITVNGKTEQRLNPLEQARDSTNRMMEMLKKVPSFIHKDGKHSSKLKFPAGYCVIFTNITRKQAQDHQISKIIPDVSCLFSDDLSFDTDLRDMRREFIAKLKQAFAVKFSFDPLTYDGLKTLRYQLFPEVRVNQVRKLRTSKDEQLIQTLDLEQERTAKSLGEGHRILKGVAGSGKTLVLACRAKYLKKLYPSWRILVVCYNISLSRYLNKLLELSGPTAGRSDIEVFHFHGLVKHLTKVDLSIRPGESDEKYDSRVGTILKGEIAKGTVKGGIYDAILVDEGQDFITDWMQGLSQLLNEKQDSLLFCYDRAQNVFGRTRPNWKSAGFKVQGKRPTELKKSYRNTVEVLEVAKRFAKLQNTEAATDDESLDFTLFPISTDRHGPKPVLFKCSNTDEQISYILNTIEQCLQNDDCKLSDIGILYPDRRFQDFPSRFSAAFKKRFEPNKIFWVSDRQDKLMLDLSTDSVKLITIHSCKGLEFKIVFLVGLESMPRPAHSEDDERTLTYVGLTRAQDVLHIPYESNSGYISELDAIVNALPERVETNGVSPA
jgi:hypothetical protein